ncbi:MAG: hypothetical protein A2340_06935 [Lentisphaerae bacterium RIFOXYB12_FULL_60_10]|nr:MAG: hypothetical protein A2269_07870 [Lentisphaerae bacterium RIFOXYA12_FULL_60_10]OGV81138.1 MAG: hypothetical protein A2340_06935 [Lentisphaerae bacterium RIFOXYB12_FULL_60_10]
MRILLVDDHKPTRDEIRALIDPQADMSVVAEADTGELAVTLARRERPDIIVMDILLPGINGIDAAREILQELPQIRILALSNHFGESLVQAILDVGGAGYVRKFRAFEELIPALRSVAAGQTYVSHGSTVRKT